MDSDEEIQVRVLVTFEGGKVSTRLMEILQIV